MIEIVFSVCLAQFVPHRQQFSHYHALLQLVNYQLSSYHYEYSIVCIGILYSLNIALGNVSCNLTRKV